MGRFLSIPLAIALCCALGFAVSGCAKGAYVGSTMSHRYHEPSCMWAEELDSERQIWFDDVAQAEDADYEPCSTCLAGQ